MYFMIPVAQLTKTILMNFVNLNNLLEKINQRNNKTWCYARPTTSNAETQLTLKCIFMCFNGRFFLVCCKSSNEGVGKI